jgi:hypothetical protein
MFKLLLASFEAVVRAFATPSVATPITNDEWMIILGDFNQGSRAGFTLITLKQDYIKRIPVLFAAIAVECEVTALKYAQLARHAFRLDPREAVHDPRTWRLMHPGSIFAAELDRFIDEGVPREHLHWIFLFEIAVFRFAMAVETVIEQRHAIASTALKRHYIGSVPLSLSSRLPMVERWIQQGEVQGLDLLSAFAEARSLLNQPNRFGVSLHPSLKGVKQPAKMRVALAKVIYRADLEHMFQSQAAAKKLHEATVRNATKQNVKILAEGIELGVVTAEAVMRTAMNDHLKGQMDSGSRGRVFSARAQSVHLEGLGAMLDEPLTKRARSSGAAEQIELGHDELEGGNPMDTNVWFFQMIYANLGKKKTVPVAIGAGNRLRDSDCSVHLHTDVRPIDGGFIFPQAAEGTESTFIYRGITSGTTLEDVREHTQVWTSGSRWALCLEDLAEDMMVTAVITEMVNLDALPNRPKSIGYRPADSQLECVHMLRDKAVVESRQNDKWYFTKEGWAKCQQLTTCSTPQLAFNVRELHHL